MLLDAKADPNIKDHFGITPLIHAAARGFVATAALLVKAGAKPGEPDGEGKSALDYAGVRRCEKV